MSNEMQRGDELFQVLAQNKKRRRRKILFTVISILLVAAVGLTVTVLYLRRKVREQYAFDTTQIHSYVVQRGTLTTVVSGTGLLTEEELEVLTVPEGVEITQILVDDHQTVSQGQLLAVVEPSSVLTAMAGIQTTLEGLDEQIRDAADDKVSSQITAGVTGRVKAVYGEKDQPVSQCMVEHGALAILSLDGFMALELEAPTLQPGDTVTVVREEGQELPGTVDAVIGGVATILISDDGPRMEEPVTVTLEGEVLGSGSLYIHEPLVITGYAGTIQLVYARENQRVYQNASLFQLRDTGTTVQYDALLRQRREQEEILLELLELRRSGGVTAPFDGSVYTVDYDENLNPLAAVTLSPDQQMTVTLAVDETDILSLELNQMAEITVSSLGEEPVFGTVTEINRTPGDTGSYSATVTLAKASGMLAGITADVNIRITGVENSLLIPLEALQQTRSGAFVYTRYDAETNLFTGEVSVVPGLQGSTQVEILSGLQEGDVVWYTEEQTIFDFFMSMGSGNAGGGSGTGQVTVTPAMPSGGQGGQPPQGFSYGG